MNKRSSKQPQISSSKTNPEEAQLISEIRKLEARFNTIKKQERQRAIDIVLSYIIDQKDKTYWYYKKLNEIAFKIMAG